MAMADRRPARSAVPIADGGCPLLTRVLLVARTARTVRAPSLTAAQSPSWAGSSPAWAISIKIDFDTLAASGSSKIDAANPLRLMSSFMETRDLPSALAASPWL
jgi:hypothetical protein